MAALRYVDDVPYERAFIPYLSPAWLDFTALLWGIKPPDRDGGFAWCDLGCGQGVNAVALGATHPNGQFHGVDAMATHVAHGERLARDVGAGNVRLHAVDFGAAGRLKLPKFDYITAHGVYSWVDDQARHDLMAFVADHLKPGGLVYISYNALPGRTADQPFQRLMMALSEAASGDSIARITAATAFVQRLHKLKIPALEASPMAEVLLASRTRRNWSYMAHEFMNPQWRPVSGVELRRTVAGIGLSPAGSATLVDNFDHYRLPKAARRVLADIEDPDLQDFVRDYMVSQSFRRDVFAGRPETLDADEQVRRLRDAPLALARPPGHVAYKMATTGGEVGFDTPDARAIVRALAAGPRSLAEIAGDPDELLSSGLALLASTQVWPVEPPGPAAERFNRVAATRWGGPDALDIFALGCGTALQPHRKVAAALHDGAGGPWRRHLAAYGAGLD